MAIMLEHPPVILCQCVLPCFQPFRNADGEWSEVGCLQPTGHEGEHSPDGPGAITYRDPAQHDGPRVVLHREADRPDWWIGQCRRCERSYNVGTYQADLQ